MKKRLSLISFVTAIIIVLTGLLIQSPPAKAVLVERVVQLQLDARPYPASNNCMNVDISKISIRTGAENVNATPCNNIQEERFIMRDAGNGYFNFALKNKGPDGKDYCLVTIAKASSGSLTVVNPCAPFSEFLYSIIDYGNGWIGLKSKVKAADNSDICLGVNGTKIGTIKGAERVATGDCRNIQEHRWKIIEVERTEQRDLTPLYEYWIVARKYKGVWKALTQLDVGHAFTTIIRKDVKATLTYTYGQLTGTKIVEGSWHRFHTYGMWPTGLKIDACSDDQGKDDCDNVPKILQGIPISTLGQAVRKSRISESRANYIHSNANLAGCSEYPKTAAAVGAKYCNCVDYTGRAWYLFSAQRAEEDFRPTSLQATFPNVLVDNINRRNKLAGSDFLDGGKTWQ